MSGHDVKKIGKGKCGFKVCPRRTGTALGIGSCPFTATSRGRLVPATATRIWLRRQQSLADFAKLALTATELGPVLDHACRLIAHGLECQIAKVLKWMPEQGELLLCAMVGIPPDLATAGKTRIPGGRSSAAGYTVLSREPSVSDLANEPRFEPGELVVRSGVRHSANVIIACGNDIYGVLEADRTDDPPLAKQDLDFLQTFASLIGAAVMRLRDAERIARLLQEKDLLLRELQHRVKNDLQVIMGIIGLQRRRATTPDGEQQLDSIAGRIDSLRLVHEHLYKGQSTDELDLGTYLQTLATDRFRMHGLDASGPIRLQIHIESLPADRNLAMPLGLIANEFITNSLKYAFPAGRGVVRLDVARLDTHHARLTLEDDGGAQPAAPAETGTGLRLIEMLARQLGAQPIWTRAGGTRLELVFGLPQRPPAIA